MGNLFNDLLKEFFDSISQVVDLDGFDIKTEKTPGGITITAIQKPVKKDNTKLLEFIKSFKDYVGQTDDFIFETACDEFEQESGITLENLQTLVDQAAIENEEDIYKYANIFKECIQASALNFIDELKIKYEL